MNAAKYGFIAEFKTGYLQREVRYEGVVAGGTDTGLRDATKTGFAPGRLVIVSDIASGANAGRKLVLPADNVSATSIGNATHIIAQSDDTIRDVPEDYNYPEGYSSLPNLICKNTGTYAIDATGTHAIITYTDVTGPKTIALYKIVNTDDIKILDLGEAPNA